MGKNIEKEDIRRRDKNLRVSLSFLEVSTKRKSMGLIIEDCNILIFCSLLRYQYITILNICEVNKILLFYQRFSLININNPCLHASKCSQLQASLRNPYFTGILIIYYESKSNLIPTTNSNLTSIVTNIDSLS